MKLVVIDTDKYSGYTCPASGKTILFEPSDDDELLDPDALTETTIVQGILVPEVGGEIQSGCEPYATRWTKSWEAAEQMADDNDEWLDLEEFIKDYEDEDLIALEITTHGIACGPVSFTVFHLVREQDWNNARLVAAE